jgi:hypothetical protein
VRFKNALVPARFSFLPLHTSLRAQLMCLSRSSLTAQQHRAAFIPD